MFQNSEKIQNDFFKCYLINSDFTYTYFNSRYVEMMDIGPLRIGLMGIGSLRIGLLRIGLLGIVLLGIGLLGIGLQTCTPPDMLCIHEDLPKVKYVKGKNKYGQFLAATKPSPLYEIS